MGWYAEVVFPWLLERIEGPEMYELRERCVRRAAGHVLEIGLGTGKSLPYYGPQVQSLTAVEPSAGMNRAVAERLEAVAFPTKLVELAGERLPFDDASFDEIVVTLTLCSVDDSMRVLAEMHRVLKPGGRYHFFEHVASDDPRHRRLQQWLNPLQRVLGCGCNMNRETERTIVGAGFAIESVERLITPGAPVYPPLFPMILGVAVRP